VIGPGKPWQNGMNEPQNDKFRDERLGMHWFKNGIGAKIPVQDFRREYNEARPRRSAGKLAPAKFRWNLASITDPELAICQAKAGPKNAGR